MSGNANWWIEDDWYVCGDCDERVFTSRSALLDHQQNSNNHAYCTECDREFDTWQGLRTHWANSAEHFFCSLCDSHWEDDEDLLEHKRDEHFECELCGSFFKTSNGLNGHYKSKKHAAATVACPARCGMSFIDRGAAVLHLEAGSCPSGATRAKIDYFVRQLDQRRFITNPERGLLPGPESEPNMQQTRWVATERSWDPQAGRYRCFLCQNLFGTLHALNQHLLSPRHSYSASSSTYARSEKLYKCPNGKCARAFATLSGLVQHAESYACGVLRVRGVESTLDGVLGGMRALAL
ncbi:hypothetical protein JCM10213_000901 [Rhodosporidiobolus nylandii]